MANHDAVSRFAVIFSVLGLTFVFWVLTPNTAWCQVNTERLRLDQTESGFHGNLDASFTLAKGNVDFLHLGGKAQIEYRDHVHRPLIIADYGFAEQGGDKFAHNALVHTRWTAMWLPWVGSELFNQVQFDEFILLELRVLGGLGARFRLLDDKMGTIFVGTGYMAEYEKLDPLPPTDPHPRRILNHRSTTYLTGKLRLLDHLTLSDTVYLQPRFDRPNDIRVLNDFNTEVALTKHLSLVISFELRYDSDPPSIVKALDVRMVNTFRASF